MEAKKKPIKSCRKVKLLHSTCLNSKWIASFLAKKDQEHCQCIGCKIRIEYKGYIYIADEQDIRRLKIGL